jgi:hypothetical protein
VAAVVHEQRHTEHLDGAAQAGAVSAQLLIACSLGARGYLLPSLFGLGSAMDRSACPATWPLQPPTPATHR